MERLAQSLAEYETDILIVSDTAIAKFVQSAAWLDGIHALEENEQTLKKTNLEDRLEVLFTRLHEMGLLNLVLCTAGPVEMRIMRNKPASFEKSNVAGISMV